MNRRMPIIAILGGVSLLWCANPTAAATEEAQPPPLEAPPVAKFGADQLDQMVAPVALYPDSLLMQVMIASTYPLEVVEADRWRRKNATLKDDALDKALEQKDWDPSVEAMTHFPDLLKRMSDNLDWTKDLGDAFLAQKDDVFDAVQRMRRRAQESGTLQTTKEQTVTKEIVNNKETIIVQPASPQVVYVPTYPPTVYGPAYAPPSPYYPAAYGYTGGQMATASLLSFGVGVGVGALISNGCDWGHNDVHVNNNYYGGGGGGGGNKNNSNSNNNVNVNVNKNNTFNKNTVNAKQQTWQHNPDHRRNVAYRDQKTSQKFESRNPSATRERQAQQQARGYDRGEGAGGGSQGARAPQPGGGSQGARAPQRGGGSQGARAPQPGGAAGASAKPTTANRGSGGQPQARPASAATGGRQDAFQGSGNGRGARESSQRGASSRGTQSWAGGGGGTQRGAGHAGSGGGGGGGGSRGGGGGGKGGGGGGKRR